MNIRVSDAERQAIAAAASEAGLSTSGFFRSLLLEGAGVQPIWTQDDVSILALLLEDMRRIGINLNQVAAALNAGRAVHDEEIKIAVGNVARMQDIVLAELRRARQHSARRRRGEG